MKHKKKVEFKKKLAVFSVVIIIGVITCDFILAFMGLVVPETVSEIVSSAAFAYLVSYAATSTYEKHSRNKYGVDANGIPYSKAETVTETSDQIGG